MIGKRVFAGLAASATVVVSLALEPIDYIDTRVGTAVSETECAGLFGKKNEEFGQVIPAVLSPRGMNFWTPQTRATELKCVAPYYYADWLIHVYRNSQ